MINFMTIIGLIACIWAALWFLFEFGEDIIAPAIGLFVCACVVVFFVRLLQWVAG